MKLFPFSILLAFACFTSCSPAMHKNKEAPLTRINIIDRNGLSHTANNPERLRQYRQTDFLKPLPYRKVMRIFDRDAQGNTHAIITTYYPNGQIKQYLEISNSRAYGNYQEWFSSGQLKVDATVIGGTADITPEAQQTWLFDGISSAWNSQGALIATIPYQKGIINGTAQTLHASGNVKTETFYSQGFVHGIKKEFSAEGKLLQTAEYKNGQKDGETISYRTAPPAIASEERFKKGKLLFGRYYSPSKKLLSQIDQGQGKQALFRNGQLIELREYREGKQEGRVEVLDEEGRTARVYHVKDSVKHGEEIEYCSGNQLKLSIHWHKGKVHGLVKTWYPNGQLESQKEMSDNIKNGLNTAWYSDGSLMLIETYRQGKLIRGEYMQRGNDLPISQITEGKGVCTLFDPEGNFVQRVHYHEGIPMA